MPWRRSLPARDTVVWDRALTGFGVRVYPSGTKVYVVQARGPDRHQAHHRGPPRGDRGGRGAQACRPRHRPHPRRRGARSRGTEDREHHRRSAGRRYLREHVAVRCKPTTATQYRLAIERYIVPALGTLPVSSLGRAQVAELQHSLSDRPAMANLTIATLSRMIDQAMAWGVAGEIEQPLPLRPEVPNPPARALPHRRGVPASGPRPWTRWRGRGASRLTRRQPSACSCSPAAGATRS